MVLYSIPNAFFDAYFPHSGFYGSAQVSRTEFLNTVDSSKRVRQ